jgi:membrane fusion protein (multidrug efflux system)
MSPPQGTLVKKDAGERLPAERHPEQPAPHDPHGGEEQVIPPDLKKPGKKTLILVAAIIVALMLVLFVVGWIPHHNQANQAQADAAEVAAQAPIVQVAYPLESASTKDLLFPANVQANQATDIYPRSTGYLKQWYVDIQDRVRAGQLLAVIDAPDIDAELNQARATELQTEAAVAKAEADVKLAQATLNRYLDAQKQFPGSVTQEDIDTNQATYDDDLAALAEAKANVVAEQAAVKQLEVQQGFEKITAPYAGIITARNYYNGALMSPTNTAAGQQMFSIVDDSVMRVFVKIPQEDATLIKDGQPTTLTVYNYPGRTFDGTVTRTSGSIDQTTRTYTVELGFPNGDAALYAGMYGTVALHVNEPKPVLLIPTSALVFNAAGLSVATVVDWVVHMVHGIEVGRDLGTQIEVTAGLDAKQQVITNPGENIAEGVKVEVKMAKAATTKPTG